MNKGSEESSEEVKEPRTKRQKTGTTLSKVTKKQSHFQVTESSDEDDDSIVRIKKYQVEESCRVPVYKLIHSIATKPSPLLRMAGPPFGTMVH